MGATNHTTNYELSQFIGTDKPSWLNDYNNDMLKIDTAVKANATAASGAQSTANTADGKADANALAIQTLNTQINTPDTGLAATVAGHTTAITGINSTIGSTPLTTVAQTLTGAIEEVKGSVPSITGLLKLTGDHVISVTGDGVKTAANLLSELFTQINTYLASKTASYRYMPGRIDVGQVLSCESQDTHLRNNAAVNALYGFSVYIDANGSLLYSVTISANPAVYLSLAGTDSNLSSTVVTNGVNVSLTITEFEVM